MIGSSQARYPEISVLMSCYNARDFLVEAIESILNQSFSEFEFLIINDGSTDDTLDIINKYAAIDCRIVVIDKPNTGLTDSLNYGINIARGKWIARIDADDIAVPSRLSRQYSYVNNNDVLLVGSGCITIDKNSKKIKKYVYPSKHDDIVRNLETIRGSFPHSSAFYHKTSVQAVGGYRIRLNGAEDLDLWLRISEVGRIGCLKVPLVMLRKHINSITAKDWRLVILSHAARISHITRVNGVPDPVEADASQFNIFLSWVEAELDRADALREVQIRFNLNQDKFITKALKTIASGRARKIILNKLFGSNLSNKLSQKWLTMNWPDSTLIKLHAVQLELLKECIRICEKYHLRYFLLGGSALGAIRHSGFIPWDDDIDIGMPRRDYEIFLSVAQAEIGTDLFVQSYMTDPFFPLNFAKIRNSKTTFIQHNVAHLNINHGVYIDIFPLDGFSSNKYLGTIRAIMFKVYRASIMYKLSVKNKKSYVDLLIRFYAIFFSLKSLRNKIENLMKTHNYDDSTLIINWGGTWGLKEVVPKYFFGEGHRAVFEDIPVKVPINYDGYLRALYGNYLELPPMQDRYSHHSAAMVDIDNPFVKKAGR